MADTCYVYKHVDPTTEQLLYVGKGTGQRAWACTGGYADARYGNRSKAHSAHLKALMSRGYLPCDWVQIVQRGLSASAAFKLETELIGSLKPRFNSVMGMKNLKLSLNQIKLARELRAKGMAYAAVASAIDTSTMTVYRVLNGKNKRTKEQE